MFTLLREELFKASQGQFYDKNNHNSITLETMVNQSFWIRQWHFVLPSRNNGMDVLDKVCWFLICYVGLVLIWNSTWMSMCVQGTICLWMACTWDWLVLCKPSMNHFEENNGSIFLKFRKLLKRMLKIVLVCCKVGLP